MTTLRALLDDPALPALPLSGLSSDSRAVQPGDVFLAVRGLHRHGLEFLAEVRAQGAVAVLWEPPYTGPLPADFPVIAVADLSHKLGRLAARFYGEPAAALELVGVTGTNGKTSCAHYIAQCLSVQARCGVLGTVGNGLYGQLRDASHTTPDALSLQRWLAQFRAQGARYVAMEVSSHALDQHRVAGLAFAVAVLTNLSRDHLDYHGDMAAYREAKRRLFVDNSPRTAVLNLDDAFGRALAAELRGQTAVLDYSLHDPAAALWGERLVLTPAGLTLTVRSPWGTGELPTRLLGRFNAANLLATLGALLALGVAWDEALARLRDVTGVPGRMECFGGGDQPLAVVDYAHTPDALEQALVTLREHTAGRLHCVFGCGGERDSGKRPQMGALAERYADRVIVTNDNPRSEDPARIITDILDGMQQPAQVAVVPERLTAIRQALAGATPDDIVLIAGKGHEDYQLIGRQRLMFSDRDTVRALLGTRS